MKRRSEPIAFSGFTLAELLIAAAIAGILITAVGQAVGASVQLARRSFSNSAAMGGSATMVEALQEDFNRARWEVAYAPQGTATNLWFGMEGDYDGDGEEDAVCYRYFTTATDTASQGYLGRVVYPNGNSPYPTSTSPTCGATPVNSPSFVYTRLTPPDLSMPDFAFSYCRPSSTVDSHQMTCGNATSSVQMRNQCSGYSPITLWAIGLTYSTTRKRAVGAAATYGWGMKDGVAAKSWRTYAFQMRNLFKQGSADSGAFVNCVGSQPGLDDNENECPDAFDHVGRLCACNCQADAFDNDGDGNIDEECRLTSDSDGDGSSGNQYCE